MGDLGVQNLVVQYFSGGYALRPINGLNLDVTTYFGEMGVLFHVPRAATARARTDATVVGYTAPAFRERLGAGGVRDLIEHRKLAPE